jgi:hypothetical protein
VARHEHQAIGVGVAVERVTARLARAGMVVKAQGLLLDDRSPDDRQMLGPCPLTRLKELNPFL